MEAEQLSIALANVAGLTHPKAGRCAGILTGLRPSPKLSVSEWADRYRLLGQRASAEPGPWRTERTPYLREILDSLSNNDPSDIVVVSKGAQLGLTEAGNNWTGYIVDHAPGPLLYVQPTIDMARRVSKQRLAPMLIETPRLVGKVRDNRSRDSGNTMLTKEFPGGILIITGANSAVGLRSMPARYIFLDEVDGYPMDVDGEGDPLDLALARTRTFRRNRKILMASTPTVKGISRIESWYLRGDQRRYFVSCPHCGVFQLITWDRIVWDRDDSGGHLPDTVRLHCEACAKPIHEHHKTELLAGGHWEATAEADDRRVRSYHISALYSPLGWYSWADAVRDFIKAKKDGQEALKAWVNTVLGETWEEDGDDIDDGTLAARRRKYEHQVPAEACLLTAGVDVHPDRIELEVVGWSPYYESWGIDYRIIHGDTQQPDPWDQLDLALADTYKHASGASMGLAGVAIDAGYGTQQVYEFVRRRAGRRLYAVMGKDGPSRPLVSSPSAKRTGRNRRPVRLFTVGVDQVKALVYSRFRITEEGPGYCHFPIGAGYDEEVFAQLTSERIVTRYTRGVGYQAWVKKRARNEALDCRVYATAALVILGELALRAAAQRLASVTGGKLDDALERSTRNRRRRGSYATSWKK